MEGPRATGQREKSEKQGVFKFHLQTEDINAHKKTYVFYRKVNKKLHNQLWGGEEEESKWVYKEKYVCTHVIQERGQRGQRM